jgi:2-dehydropantoate 2-reductase
VTRARVAVVGVGAIGAVFACAVQQAGNADLVLCGRRPAGQVVVTRDGAEPVVVGGPIVSDPQSVDGPVDWIFLAVKAHQTAGAAEWLAKLAGPETVVVVLQNGVEHRDRVAPLVPGSAILPAVVWTWAEAIAPGLVQLRGKPRIIVPRGGPGRALARLLATTTTVELASDFTTDAWRKLCGNAVAALMALTGRRAAVFQDAEVAELARALASECIEVANAEGANLPARVADEIVDDFQSMPAGVGSSILYDREAMRPLEWDARNGVIRRLGARHGIATPISDIIVPLLAATSEIGTDA